jgi:hypothetical protein
MADVLRWDEFFRRFTDAEAAAVLNSADPLIVKWRDMYRNKPRPCMPDKWADVASKLVEARPMPTRCSICRICARARATSSATRRSPPARSRPPSPTPSAMGCSCRPRSTRGARHHAGARRRDGARAGARVGARVLQDLLRFHPRAVASRRAGGAGVRSGAESGDTFVVRRYRKDPGDVYGTKLQLIEADRFPIRTAPPTPTRSPAASRSTATACRRPITSATASRRLRVGA